MAVQFAQHTALSQTELATNSLSSPRRAGLTHRLTTLAAGLASALLLASSRQFALTVRRTPLRQLLVLG